MKKTIFALVFTLLFTCVSVFGDAGTVNIYIDGERLASSDAQGFIENKRVYVPVRSVLESYGVDSILWEAPFVKIQRGDINVTVEVGQKYIIRNGVRTEIDVPAVIRASHVYLPIRAVIVALGGLVDWNDSEKSVYIQRPSIASIDATSQSNNDIERTDLVAEKPVKSPDRTFSITKNTDKINRAQFSPDGSQLCSLSDDASVRLWDLNTGRMVFEYKASIGMPMSASFSPDGKQVAVTTGEDTVIFSTGSGNVLIRRPKNVSSVIDAVFSRDGSAVLSVSYDGTSELWNSNTGKSNIVLDSNMDITHAVDFNPNGRTVLTCGSRLAQIWDVKTGKELGRYEATGPYGTCFFSDARFSPDGKTVVFESGDGRAQLWEGEQNYDFIRNFDHSNDFPVISALFSPDGKRLVTTSLDDNSIIWDVFTGNVLKTIPKEKESQVYAVFSPDGKLVLAGSKGMMVSLWDTATGENVMRLSGGDKELVTAEFSPDGKYVFAITGGGSVCIWNLNAVK